MSIKTNKSFAKRLKITKRGKILGRKSGENHFNAKESRSKQLSGKGWTPVVIKRKTLTRLLPMR